ncbi:MAG: hypothetical protein GFH27_549323n7 [Chloroflexi bacterium AL-W]|nr:hypothetical protein [Chloroflexi bacterium AL-N1]NOK70158.1 hypothetical protein [Chloroflexi bacterium AL-N10]NOK77695.1 hypothetical protein [Chloroflexi bacterium AL-N5]NOK84704.1 hypothetical protein [Chloroflexi bacterium AL-W]NOK93233.1 hypothetical protein [Chloroflexi bacterium AL-N15]
MNHLPTPQVDTVFNFRGFYDGAAHCGLRIWQHLDDVAVVMLTELPDNPGISVTNAFEFIATQVVRGYSLSPTKTIWIEHCPKDQQLAYSLVTLKWQQQWRTHYAPQWGFLNDDALRRIVTAPGVYLQQSIATKSEDTSEAPECQS